MLKKIQSLTFTSRTAIKLSFATGVVVFIFGLLVLYVVVANPGGGGMAGLVWIFPLIVIGRLTFILAVISLFLNLAAALTEPSVWGKRVCYISCLLFLSLVSAMIFYYV